MIGFIDNFAKEIIGSGLASSRAVSGCTPDEIKTLEEHFCIGLPIEYKTFLERMGKGAGRFLQGTDIFYRHLFQNRSAMEEVLELDKCPFPLLRENFVFSSHQGYIFFFFDTSSPLDDPPVYGYMEGDLKSKLIANSFTEFLTNTLNEEIEAWANIKT